MAYSTEILEFSKLLELAARFAQTPMGAERILDLRPLEIRPELDDALAAVTEAIFLIEEK
jgi:dsDNA-specific endonuclease/ATPase MutS2